MDVESDQSESPIPISEADFVRLFARHELALRNYARLILHDWSGVDDYAAGCQRHDAGKPAAAQG